MFRNGLVKCAVLVPAVLCAYVLTGIDAARAFSCNDPASRSPAFLDTCSDAGKLDALYRVDDAFTVAVKVGSTRIDFDITAADPLSGSRLASGTNSARFFDSLGLNGDWMLDSWTLGAHAGTLYGRDDRIAFTRGEATGADAEKGSLGRLTFGGRIGYLIDELFEPYAGAAFAYGHARKASPYDDRVGIVLGGGLNIFATENISANLEGTTTTLRSNLDIFSINARVRFDF